MSELEELEQALFNAEIKASKAAALAGALAALVKYRVVQTPTSIALVKEAEELLGRTL